MFKTKIAARCCAVAAAAVLSAGCGGFDVPLQEVASSANAEVPVGAPLVDDDGLPMPPVVPPDAARAKSADGGTGK
jgi:hypothetical protein